MVSINKIKFYILLVVLTFFITILNTPQNYNCNKDENFTSLYRFEKIKENSLIISGPISINDAQDWIDLKNEGKCVGEGTQIDPYIISNLKINGNGLICIAISQVRDVYYKILNCELYNGSYGIKITYADMGDIIGNNISYNTYGIDTFISPPYPTNKLISDNFISHNEDGGITCIPLYDCEISNNIITYNGHHGIH
ncbi:MAG: right-handed parallel beta-helix repeat-containing protein, partial [Promethearchaeota archaeon]